MVGTLSTFDRMIFKGHLTRFFPDGITEGLICVFAVVDPCQAFAVRSNAQAHKLEAVRQYRKCLHFYFYYLDTEFGFVHVRLQSWFPFGIQGCSVLGFLSP